MRAWDWVKFIKWVRGQNCRVKGKRPEHPPHIKLHHRFQHMHPLQRGHVPLQVASLGFQVTAPLYTRLAARYAISTRGAATPRARAVEVLGKCFASVSQCAGAQTWIDTARWRIVLASHTRQLFCHMTARPYTAASRYAWWPRNITA
jgi:hypothetical protein